MSKGRAVPDLTPKEAERRRALLTLDIPAMRSWAKRYAVGLLGDDRTVLISMHETRVIDPVITLPDRQISVAWLLENYIESAVIPHTLITDQASIIGYRDAGYTFQEARPYWALYSADGSLYALVDRAAAEAALALETPREAFERHQAETLVHGGWRKGRR